MDYGTYLISGRGNLFLIGPRCAGKTTVGGMAARLLGRPFRDTDDLILAEAGRGVSEIVESEGWPGFRLREAKALRAAAEPGGVVGTGGGIILDPANRAFMRERGLVIYLEAGVETLLERMLRDTGADRPSLTGQDPGREIAQVLAAREAFYLESAHARLNAAPAAGEVARAVLDFLRRSEAPEKAEP